MVRDRQRKGIIESSLSFLPGWLHEDRDDVFCLLEPAEGRQRKECKQVKSAEERLTHSLQAH